MSSLHQIRPKGKPNPYTSAKLNLLKAARFDRTVKDFEYRVLSGLTEHIRRDGTARVPDETLATEIGCSWPQSIGRARLRLRDKGYVTWERTQKENIYAFNFAKAKAILDTLAKLKSERRRIQPPRGAVSTHG
jgi:hypothetical protein